MSDLFSSAAAFLLRSLLAGDKKNVSMPCMLFALAAFGAAFAWMETKRSAILSFANLVLDLKFIKTSVDLVKYTL